MAKNTTVEMAKRAAAYTIPVCNCMGEYEVLGLIPVTRDEPEQDAPAQESGRSRFEEEPVSPIFQNPRTRQARESADSGYETRERRNSGNQPRRSPRVYQEDGVSEPRPTQNRRGFTPDVPSFMRKK